MKHSQDLNCRDLHKHRLSRDKLKHYGKGRHSSPCLQLERLEGDVKLQKIIGNAQSGKTGLGYRKMRSAFTDSNKEHRYQVGLFMRREAEQKRLVYLQSYELQNSWLKWGLSDMMEKDLTWNKIMFGYSEKLLKFVLNSNLQTLATPDNLKRWKVTHDAPCGLCTRANVGLSHVLAGCPWVLKVENKMSREDRNTWRHNCVLLEMAGAVRRKVTGVNNLPVQPNRMIKFIPAGKRPTPGPPLGILNEARDWVCDFDLADLHSNTHYQFPINLDVGLRCDGYILSRSKCICIILELTVPMEEHIEHWHQVKSDKYGNLFKPGWTFYCFAIEIGCRGFVPPRFSSITRRLGFSSSEFRQLRDNLQLVARKCSYVIWLNRFNKDFNSTIRITADGDSMDDGHVPDPSVHTAVVDNPGDGAIEIDPALKTRASRNREAALLRLRESNNRRAARLKLWKKKQASTLPQAVRLETIRYGDGATTSSTISSSVNSLVQTTSPPPPLSSLDGKTSSLAGPIGWSLLDSPGLTLRNSRNNCWFHSTLYLLTGVPSIRFFCSSLPQDLEAFDRHLFSAIGSIVNSRDPSIVSAFFPLVKDCDGVQHRYGQIAVPDFIDYLCSHSSRLSHLLTFTLTTQLQCSQCHWVRYPSSHEVTLKLYFPSDRKLTTLEDFVDYNSRAALDDDNTVYCPTCGVNTTHDYLRSCDPDVFLLELCRVAVTPRGSMKINAPLSFRTDLKLPGFSRRYRVVASAHHRGTLRGGHWFTKVCTKGGWFQMDDLRKKHSVTDPPGFNDKTVAILLLIATDKLS